MAPEQLQIEPVDWYTHLFAIADVFCEILIGEPAFSGISETAIPLQVAEARPVGLPAPASSA